MFQLCIGLSCPHHFWPFDNIISRRRVVFAQCEVLVLVGPILFWTNRVLAKSYPLIIVLEELLLFKQGPQSRRMCTAPQRPSRPAQTLTLEQGMEVQCLNIKTYIYFCLMIWVSFIALHKLLCETHFTLWLSDNYVLVLLGSTTAEKIQWQGTLWFSLEPNKSFLLRARPLVKRLTGYCCTCCNLRKVLCKQHYLHVWPFPLMSSRFKAQVIQKQFSDLRIGISNIDQLICRLH